MFHLLGWSQHQWARVMASHDGPRPESVNDVVRIQHDYRKTHRKEPQGVSSLAAADILLNYSEARRVFNIVVSDHSSVRRSK